MSEHRRGLLYGIAAYGAWGLIPLYWPLLEPASALEVLAHRFVWSLAIVVLLLLIQPRRGWWAALRARPKVLLALVFAGVVIAVNWGTYIWGVMHDQVLQASLGYFINPLVLVLAGVVAFRERLRTAQWIAMGIATAAVLVLVIGYGQIPWVAFGLAATFATYGLLKKKAGVGAVESLTVETAVISPLAVGYLVWMEYAGDATFGHHGLDNALLLVGAGLVTAVPLLFFAGAANRISLTMIGLLQYIGPTLQFLLGVFVFAEPMPPERLAGFALVWVALAVFTADGLLQRRRRAAEREPAPVEAGSCSKASQD